jgi:DNA-nicking Smr family endonuclease
MTRNSEEILSYVNKYGIVNKDAQKHGSKKIANTKKKASHKRHPRERLDLHGFNSTEASILLRNVVHRCRDEGIKELLVIHGIGYHSSLSGGPVLKQLVKQMLENELNLNIRDFRTALPKDGGDGATLVYLR